MDSNRSFVAALNTIEHTFGSANAQLDLLQHKLNALLDSNFQGQVCPHNLLTRLQCLQNELPQLSQNASVLSKRKQALLRKLCLGLTENHRILHTLTTDSAILTNNQHSSTLPNKTLSETSQPDQAPECSRQDKVTDKEFEALSSIIRGRSKLSHVNELHEQILGFFDRNPKTQILSFGQLAQLGARVSGHTGQSALNALRHLNLIEMSKEGISLPSKRLIKPKASGTKRQ